MKLLTAFFILLTLVSCDGGGNRNASEVCEPFRIAFTPIPECVSEYFLTKPTNCDCIGTKSEFSLSLLNFDFNGYTGFISPHDIIWEPVDCSTISFTGEAAGFLENMTVPETGIFEFTLSFEGTDPEEAVCCCRDFLIVE
ncbi:MAG: hypothetical protein KJ002_14270 [Candidatus Dadabacteria bacterium]|nr:hypothetical protein [Candidatus Dadabacteria bacterium]